MALFENFPYTNLHELNLDWVINEINNLKAGQVLSVNGQTGDVILYQDNDILFPAVTDAHWSMVRSADGTTRGIMFGSDGKAYIVHGNSMEQIYSLNNQPPYPVTSVNGQTGAVSLFTDNNGTVAFPTVTNPNIEGMIIGRSINGTPVYLQINTDGTAGIVAGENDGEIYTTQNTDKNVFALEQAGSTETGTQNTDWGIVREVSTGNIGIMFRLGETPQVFLRYQDQGDIWQNLELLTTARDAPIATNIPLTNQDSTTVYIETQNLEKGFAPIETGTTASQSYNVGQFMFWKHKLYSANTNINISDTLNDDLSSPDPINVSEVPIGGLNALLSVDNTIRNELNLYRATYDAQNITTTENGYIKICNYSDIAQNITQRNIVSVIRTASSITGVTCFEVYSDGIYLYTTQAQTNKWIQIAVIYTSYAMTT